jgi:glutaconyl-CoA/methylmalonyl-CoA decarboxylase subunit delta
MDFDTLTTILAVIGVGALLWWGALKLGRFLSWIEREEIARQKAEAAAKQSRKAPASAPARDSRPDAIPAAHIAAIAAAVGAIDGAHAIVHIGVAGAASAWAVEGRWLQQTSHRPH